MPSLFVLQGPDKGHRYEVAKTPTLIGRGSPAVPLSDQTVSRHHARLLRRNGRWRVQDMKSANGTFVNGVRITGPMDLHPGDHLRCGTTLFVFGEEERPGVMAEAQGGLRLDERGDYVESSIMSTQPSMDDSVVMVSPETEHAMENLRLLYDMSKAVSNLFDPQQLLERVMDMVFGSLPADRGFILLRGEEEAGEAMEGRVLRYRHGDEREQIAVSTTIVNHVVGNKEGVICSNAMRDPRFAKGASIQSIGIRSALCAPIVTRDRVLGVIYVDSTVATHTYSADQLGLLTALGRQAGMALENARLYQTGLKAERLAAVGETVAYLSHGIKNILQSLQSAADMVNRGLEKDKPERVKQGWAIVQRNLNRVHNLVLNMLAYSKQRKPNREMTQLNQLLAEVVETVSGQAQEKGVTLSAKPDEALPAVPVDPDGIQQALLNLVLNALDAMPAGREGRIRLKSKYDSEAGEVVLSVLDNGPGIAPEDLETIFSPFVSSKGQGGTGLGLAVVKKTVEEHGGYAKVSSVVGKGTKFELHVPIREEGVDKEGTEGPAGRSDMAHPRSDEDIHATQDLLPEELEEAQRRAEMTQEQE